MHRRHLFALALAAAVATPAFAAKPEIFTGLVEGVGAGGYDPVSYFDAAGPMEGKTDITHDWKGATWRFASAANRDAFAAAPEKFAPQYGGYCAYAVSKGATAKGDPTAWTVVDGKLYLNLSASVKTIWSGDIPGNVTKADANWPKVLE